MSEEPAGDPLGDRFDDFYEVLGLDPGEIDDTAVEEAYRETVKRAHPDVSDNPDEELLALARKARDVLGEPESRDRYQRLGHQKYIQLFEDGQFVIESDSRASTPERSPGSSTPPAGDSGPAPASATDTGDGGSVGVTEREESAGPTTSADIGAYSSDETFDYARAEQADEPLNAPSHVTDVFHQAWLARVGVIGGGLALGSGVAYLGGPGGVGVLAPVAGVVESVGVATASFLLAVVLTVAIFGYSGLRSRRTLYAGAEDPSQPTYVDLKAGSGLVAVALGLAVIGSQQAATHPWVYSRGLFLGEASGSSPWTALVGIQGSAGQVIDSLASGLVIGGFLFGGGLVVAGMAHRAWYRRFMAGQPTRPVVWELVAVLPLVAICWGVLFGAAPVTVLGSVSSGGVVPGGDHVSFAGLTLLAAGFLLGGAILQDLLYRQLGSNDHQ